MQLSKFLGLAKNISLFFFVILFLSKPHSALAATSYYVSPSGSDSAAGSLSAPYKTVNYAISKAKAGDTIYLRAGTYRESVALSQSGTSSARITLSAYSGEEPIIDGTGLKLSNDGLVQVKDGVNYITINGLTIQNSPDMGLANRGSHNIFSNNKIRLSYDTAVWHRFGTDNIFRDNEVYFNELSNASTASLTNIICRNDTSFWPAALNTGEGVVTASTWENNYVHNNCGEGIVVADGDIVTHNTFRDNWSINIYFDETVNATAIGNLIYETESSYIARGNDGSYRNLATGIAIADEVSCRSKNNTIANNLVINARYGFSFYQYQSCSGLVGTKIINNTFVDTWDYGIRINSGTHSGNQVANNIIRSKQGKLLHAESIPGNNFGHNLWYSSSGTSSQFEWGSSTLGYDQWVSTSQSTGNIWADPILSGNPSSWQPAALKLTSTSAAINSGTTTSITTDYDGNARPAGGSFDIGAYEYLGNTQTPPPVSPSPSPSVAPTPKPGDLNNDGTVNILDFSTLIKGFGTIYNILDFNTLLQNFGK